MLVALVCCDRRMAIDTTRAREVSVAMRHAVPDGAFCLVTKHCSCPKETVPRAASNLLRRVGAMNDGVNTATQEREEWRARILRALAELRGDDLVLVRKRDD